MEHITIQRYFSYVIYDGIDVGKFWEKNVVKSSI